MVIAASRTTTHQRRLLHHLDILDPLNAEPAELQSIADDPACPPDTRAWLQGFLAGIGLRPLRCACAETSPFLCKFSSQSKGAIS